MTSSPFHSGVQRLARTFFPPQEEGFDYRKRHDDDVEISQPKKGFDTPRQTARSSRFSAAAIDVYLANKRLTSEIYDVALPDEVFVRMFETVRRSAKGVQKTLHKTYCYKDLVYENFCNDEVRAHRTLVRDVERWEDCVGAMYTREKMPVSSFPCTTSLDNVMYVKTYTVKLHSRTVIIFESMIDRSGRKINQIHVKGHLGNTGNFEEEEASRKTAFTIEQTLARLRDLRNHNSESITIPTTDDGRGVRNSGSNNNVIVDISSSLRRRNSHSSVSRKPGAEASTCEIWD